MVRLPEEDATSVPWIVEAPVGRHVELMDGIVSDEPPARAGAAVSRAATAKTRIAFTITPVVSYAEAASGITL
jgi:hypothetical protein